MYDFKLTKTMPSSKAMGELCSSRYYDYPMPGSIYRLPDDLRLQRGPTLVQLPTGEDVQVAADIKTDVRSSANKFDMQDNKAVMEQLLAMMSGKQLPQGPKPAPGFRLETPGFAGRQQQMPRVAGIHGGGVHGAF